MRNEAMRERAVGWRQVPALHSDHSHPREQHGLPHGFRRYEVTSISIPAGGREKGRLCTRPFRCHAGAGSVILGERAGWGAPASAKGEPGGSANGLKNGCSSYVCPVWCLSCVTCTDSFLLYMYWAVLPPNPPTHRSSEVFRRQISPAGRLPGPEVPILTGFAR